MSDQRRELPVKQIELLRCRGGGVQRLQPCHNVCIMQRPCYSPYSDLAKLRVSRSGRQSKTYHGAYVLNHRNHQILGIFESVNGLGATDSD